MKKTNLLKVWLCLILTYSSFSQDLMITGIFDGPLSGGTPKGIELYVINDIEDLSIYGIGVANNGGGTDGVEFNFPQESSAAGSYLYVTTNNDQFFAFFGFEANYESGTLAVNGDDAVELFLNDNLIDVFGDANIDATDENWEYTDGWAYRNNGITASTNFQFSDWTFSGINIFDGTETNESAPNPFPYGTFTTEVSTEPSIKIVSPNSQNIPATEFIGVDLSIQNFNLSKENSEGQSDETGDGFVKLILEEEGVIITSIHAFSSTIEDLIVTPGKSYSLSVELVDNNGSSLTPIVSDSFSFSIELPCDLLIEEVVLNCEAETTEIDTYQAILQFSGGDTNVFYSISIVDHQNNPVGMLSGDHPNEIAEGQLMITNIPEGQSINVIIQGDENSSCDLSIPITSPTCLPAATCGDEGAIIITEIMQNPSAVTDSNGEYFEVYNTTDSEIDLFGWTISTFSTGDPVSHTITSSLVISPQGFLVFGENAEITTNGGIPVDYQYDSGLFLGNGSATIRISCEEIIVDSVSYDNGDTFPDPNGASMELAFDKYSHAENDQGGNWAEAVQEIVSGGDLGTPGFANSNVLSVAQENIQKIMLYPNPTYDKNVTLQFNANISRKVLIFDALGKQVFSKTIDSKLDTLNLIDLNHGVYVLKILEGQKVMSSKLVIQ